jgi:hypothetical protein
VGPTAGGEDVMKELEGYIEVLLPRSVAITLVRLGQNPAFRKNMSINGLVEYDKMCADIRGKLG